MIPCNNSTDPKRRNVPGSALYFFALSEVRDILANTRGTWQPLLNKAGVNGETTSEYQRWENLFSGSTARGAVGYLMMPITVIKVRYEVFIFYFTSETDLTHIFYVE